MVPFLFFKFNVITYWKNEFYKRTNIYMDPSIFFSFDWIFEVTCTKTLYTRKKNKKEWNGTVVKAIYTDAPKMIYSLLINSYCLWFVYINRHALIRCWRYAWMKKATLNTITKCFVTKEPIGSMWKIPHWEDVNNNNSFKSFVHMHVYFISAKLRYLHKQCTMFYIIIGVLNQLRIFFLKRLSIDKQNFVKIWFPTSIL